jgi:Tol biopolymer transport system component/DNA-binding winged helix-turn-helix (wHTH) protein
MNSRESSLDLDPGSIGPLRVGTWVVHPALNRISAGDQTVQVEPRIMHVLVCLASRPGEVLSRSLLLQSVWGEVIVAEEALTVAISELRRIFSDDPRSPSYIETIRKGGYRLIAPVSPLEAASSGSPVAAGDEARARTPASARHLLRAALILGAAAILSIAVVLLRSYLPDSGASHVPGILQGIPFTTFPGRERYPALSPDGMQVAFSWAAPGEDYYSLYVRQANTETPLRLTEDAAHDTQPTWSPDGSTIAFVRIGERIGIYSVPSIGGQVRRLLYTDARIDGIDWSPDGKWLVFSAPPRAGVYNRLTLLSLETLETEPLTSSASQHMCDYGPRFSPDGGTIAFARSSGAAYLQDIWLIAAGGGTERQVTSFQRRVDGLDWVSDGKQLIFAASPGSDFSLWRLDIDHGAVSWLPTRGSWVTSPSVSAAGNRLVYEDLSFEYNIWHIRRSAAPGSLSSPSPLIGSTRMDYSADLSPDGTRLVFVSLRSGHRELWVCGSDGSDPRQLTSLRGTYLTRPRWAPDGERIAFSAYPEGYASIYLVEVEVGVPRRLTHGCHHDIFAVWSPDGEWLYFDSDRGERSHVWRMRPDGSRAEELPISGCETLYAARDGESLYCFQYGSSEIWRMPIAGVDEPTRLVEGHISARWAAWEPTEEGIYFIQREPGGSVLGFCDIARQESDRVATLSGFVGYNLCVALDETLFLFDRSERSQSDLILVEGFH